MDIEQLELLAKLQLELKTIKASEMKLRKRIMSEISDGYSPVSELGTNLSDVRKKFEWMDGSQGAVVTCAAKVLLDKYLYEEYRKSGKLDDLSDEEKACIKLVPTVVKTKLAGIQEDSVIYELLEAADSLSTIQFIGI